MPNFLLPFGPFHMVVLHLPIGALAAIWFLEILLVDKDKKQNSKAIGLLYLFLILSTAATIILGLAYAELGKYGDEIDAHELWGYIFGGGLLVTYFCYWSHRFIGKRTSHLIYLFTLIATTIAMIVTGHFGGELVHGKGFLTKPFKNETRKPTVIETPEASTVVTAIKPSTPPKAVHTATPQPTATAKPTATAEPTAVPISSETTSPTVITESTNKDAASDSMAPMMDTTPPPMPAHAVATVNPKLALFESTQAIFKRHCYNCHGATKQKGGYRIDQKESIYLAGKSDLPAVVPGDPDDSELMYRMLLPRDDDDVMPPESKDAVSPEDIETVRQWIEAGAYWPDQAELNTAPSSTVKIGDADTDKLINQINLTGAKAEYNAWGDDSLRVDLGVVNDGQLNLAISQLNNLKDKLTWLDCSELNLSQAFLNEIQQLSNLQRLHLDGSNISDEQLNALSQLPKLNYLNLYNTQITDAGLLALQNCSNLQKIFLSQTNVSSEGIAQLKKALPKLEVIVE
jgi:mono/diheme cytochrome c family protein/uncharacterized membrane protein